MFFLHSKYLTSLYLDEQIAQREKIGIAGAVASVPSAIYLHKLIPDSACRCTLPLFNRTRHCQNLLNKSFDLYIF